MILAFYSPHTSKEVTEALQINDHLFVACCASCFVLEFVIDGGKVGSRGLLDVSNRCHSIPEWFRLFRGLSPVSPPFLRPPILFGRQSPHNFAFKISYTCTVLYDQLCVVTLVLINSTISFVGLSSWEDGRFPGRKAASLVTCFAFDDHISHASRTQFDM